MIQELLRSGAGAGAGLVGSGSGGGCGGGSGHGDHDQRNISNIAEALILQPSSLNISPPPPISRPPSFSSPTITRSTTTVPSSAIKTTNSEAAVVVQNLRCPRCDSTNTKFCYYNNYNLTQPRHFCKTCRRYWTKGGALRNVPIGGGCRKNKTAAAAAAACASTSSAGKSGGSAANYKVKMAALPFTEDQYGHGRQGLLGHGFDQLDVAAAAAGWWSSPLLCPSPHQDSHLLTLLRAPPPPQNNPKPNPTSTCSSLSINAPFTIKSEDLGVVTSPPLLSTVNGNSQGQGFGSFNNELSSIGTLYGSFHKNINELYQQHQHQQQQQTQWFVPKETCGIQLNPNLLSSTNCTGLGAGGGHPAAAANRGSNSSSSTTSAIMFESTPVAAGASLGFSWANYLPTPHGAIP
ncbi:hypothetical protein Dimus_014330 [Dionaea muscipula]